MKGKKHQKLKWILIVLGIILIGGGGYFGYKYYQLESLQKMSYQDMLSATLKDEDKGKISVAIVKPSGVEMHLYGKNGEEMDWQSYTYEIGSISKTFTGALIARAIEAGKINLDTSISDYLALPKVKTYPTIKQLVTHTSGYKSYYLSHIDLSTLFSNRNGFHGASKEELLETVATTEISMGPHDFSYSNFGVGVLGLVLEEVYQQSYEELLKNFLVQDLKMTKSFIGDGKTGDLGNYWQWSSEDGYIPAGAICSTLEDMVVYTQLVMSDQKDYLSMMHQPLAKNNKPNPTYQKLGIAVEDIGLTWMLDTKNNIIWHNGATGAYNSYLGFNKEKDIGVVILSNLANDFRIPATIMGPQLMKELLHDN